MAEKLFKLTEQPLDLAKRIKSDEDRSIFLQAVDVLPMRYWVPNGAQEKYINAVAASYNNHPIPVTLVTFGNGCGKTTASVHILLNIILGAQNGWFDYPLFTEPFKNPKLAWIMSTAEAIDGTIVPLIDALVPKKFSKYKIHKNKKGKSIVAEILLNDWTIVFKTFEQDPKTYESANVGIGIIDEPMGEELWKAYKSRRRMGNLTLMPMTPLDCPPYIIDEVKENADRGQEGYTHLTASVYDVCKERGVRGHLNPKIIDAMVDGYDAEERDARAYGKFMYFSGMIYPEWDDKIHCVRASAFPMPDKRKYSFDILQVVDPHDGRFSASVWAFVSVLPTGEERIVVFGDAPDIRDRPFWQFKRSLTTEEEVQSWIDIEKRLGIDKMRIHRVMDKRFGWQSRGSTCLADLYAEAGEKLGRDFAFSPSYDSPTKEGEIHYGHRMVKQALKPLSDGIPKLVVWKSCTHVINGMKHYIRKKMTGKASDDFATADGKIIEKYKDFPDVIRYLICERPEGMMHEAPMTELERDIEDLYSTDYQNTWSKGIFS
jgi:hypothetical protein